MSHQISTSSPDSSEPLDSVQATPATKFSAFSPESTRLSSSSSIRGIIRPRVPPPFDLHLHCKGQHAQGSHKDSAASSFHDPFVTGTPLTSTTTRSSLDPSKLSPAAAAFTPASVLESPIFTDHSNTATAGTKVIKPGNGLLEPDVLVSPTQVRPEYMPKFVSID